MVNYSLDIFKGAFPILQTYSQPWAVTLSITQIQTCGFLTKAHTFASGLYLEHRYPIKGTMLSNRKGIPCQIIVDFEILVLNDNNQNDWALALFF